MYLLHLIGNCDNLEWKNFFIKLKSLSQMCEILHQMVLWSYYWTLPKNRLHVRHWYLLWCLLHRKNPTLHLPHGYQRWRYFLLTLLRLTHLEWKSLQERKVEYSPPVSYFNSPSLTLRHGSVPPSIRKPHPFNGPVINDRSTGRLDGAGRSPSSIETSRKVCAMPFNCLNIIIRMTNAVNFRVSVEMARSWLFRTQSKLVSSSQFSI